MIFYSIFDLSAVQEDVDKLREKIKSHFSNKVNLKKAESVIGKALLCELLSNQFSLTDFFVDCDKNGKPFIVGSNICFNISHSGSYVMCVCSNSSVGCDIQQINPYNEKIARRFFTSGESELLNKCEDKSYTFTTLWALKESALKFSGEGISGGLDLYDFSSYYNKNSFSMSGLSFYRMDINDCIYAICTTDISQPIYIEASDFINNIIN